MSGLVLSAEMTLGYLLLNIVLDSPGLTVLMPDLLW